MLNVCRAILGVGMPGHQPNLGAGTDAEKGPSLTGIKLAN
jgi:hypothetical protein